MFCRQRSIATTLGVPRSAGLPTVGRPVRRVGRAGLSCALVALLSGALCLAPVALAQSEEQTADAQPNPGDAARARHHFKMGVEFFRESNFGAALIEFERAYELVPHYKVLFNLGQTYIELQEYGKAVEALQGYLDKGGSAVSDQRREQVEALIEMQRARLVTVRVQCNETGARIYVDENMVGTTPLDGAIEVGAGRRRIRVVKEGFVTAEQRVDLGAGDEQTLSFELEPSVTPGEVADAPPPPPASEPVVVRVESRSDAGLWVAGISTLVLGGATATLALLTASAESDLTAERGRVSTEDRLRGLSDDVKLRARLTDVGLGLTLASAALTTVLWVIDDEDASDVAAGVSLDLRPDHAALHLRGSF